MEIKDIIILMSMISLIYIMVFAIIISEMQQDIDVKIITEVIEKDLTGYDAMKYCINSMEIIGGSKDRISIKCKELLGMVVVE